VPRTIQPSAEDTIMKFHAISIAIVLAGVAGIAAAGNTMQAVTVSGSAIAQCAPPDDTAGRACDRFHDLIRKNFTAREIGMLFGNRSSYPEFLTGGIDRLQRRYEALMQAYLAGQIPVQAASLVIR
jgi:hypothetical protein